MSTLPIESDSESQEPPTKRPRQPKILVESSDSEETSELVLANQYRRSVSSPISTIDLARDGRKRVMIIFNNHSNPADIRVAFADNAQMSEEMFGMISYSISAMHFDPEAGLGSTFARDNPVIGSIINGLLCSIYRSSFPIERMGLSGVVADKTYGKITKTIVLFIA